MANEKRLIDANAFGSEISKMFRPYGDGTYPGDYETMIHDETLVDVLETIYEAPTVDAVEVVRCKDCKKCHSWEAPNGATGYECDYHGEDVKLDDFCSYGERRTDG